MYGSQETKGGQGNLGIKIPQLDHDHRVDESQTVIERMPEGSYCEDAAYRH